MLHRSFLRSAALLGTVVLAFVATGRCSHAATFVVASTADTPGDECGPDCTLRQALTASNANPDADTIVFDPVVFATRQTIALTPGLSEFNNSLPDILYDLSIIGPTTPGAGVTIRNGMLHKAAIFQMNSPQGMPHTVSIANLTLTGARMAIMNVSATTTVTGCTLVDNMYGIEHWSCQSGIPTEEQIKLHPYRLLARVDRLTCVTANNCTITGGGVGVYSDMGPVFLNSCTITGNEIGVESAGGTQTLSNCLVVGNARRNTYAPEKAEGHIFVDQHSITKGTPAEVGLDPRGLQDNGGPTQTIALLKGGQAVGSGAVTLATDQRGFARPATRPFDVGAFQTQPLLPTPESEQ